MAGVKSAAYLRFVRSHGCIVCGRPAHAHHVQYLQFHGMAQKVDDDLTVPLCPICHHKLHEFGREETWWALQGVDPEAWIEKAKEEWTSKS